MTHLTTRKNLKEFFKERVLEAMRNQRLERSEPVEFYLVNLLAAFAKTESFTKGAEARVLHVPLALKLKEALETQSLEERFSLLRDLGDVALYVSGFFPEYLSRRAVDFTYYASMGEGAYASVSSLARKRAFNEEVVRLFQELAANFTRFTDVLAEIAEDTQLTHSQGILRLYERWYRTQSPSTARKLKELGLFPTFNPPKKGTIH